ncbi:MAG: hypothetical protein COB50_04280 [Thiotrichales bacterium]|nr:MAG: hypothetical protein COB50_04280 [Thiotrichales bacterium]
MEEEVKKHNYYTIILEHDEKLYLLQLHCKNHIAALVKWVEIFSDNSVNISLLEKHKFIIEVQDEFKPTLLDEITTVWSSGIDTANYYCLINVICTEKYPGESSLYTFIFDFLGGTYISQYTSKDINAAKAEWAKNFDFSIIKIPEDKKTVFINSTSNTQLSSVKNLQSVWYMRPKIADQYGELHVIATEY